MPAVEPRTRVDDDGSGSDETHIKTVHSRGWSLRLLLSLEERERTRTRLLATEVVAGVVAEIIDVIPSKVGTRDRKCYCSMYCDGILCPSFRLLRTCLAATKHRRR